MPLKSRSITLLVVPDNSFSITSITLIAEMALLTVSSIIAKVIQDSELSSRPTSTTGPVREYLETSAILSRKLDVLNDCADQETTLNSISDLVRNTNIGFTADSQSDLQESQDHPQSSSHGDILFTQEENIEWQWQPSARQATFSTRGQIRRGSAHGRGGRLRGSAAHIRKNYHTYSRTVMYNRLYNLLSVEYDPHGDNGEICTDTPAYAKDRAYVVVEKMLENLFLEPGVMEPGNDIRKPQDLRGILLQELQQWAGLKIPKSVEHLPCCILGVTARFAKSDFVEPNDARSYNVRERHIISTWVDGSGKVRFNCIGSTQYEIYALNDEFDTSYCLHAEAFTRTLRELCSSLFGEIAVPVRILYKGFESIYDERANFINRRLTIFQKAHGGKTILFIDRETNQDHELCWIPIRKMQRSGGRPICAFCDLVDANQCFHISAFRNVCCRENGIQYYSNMENIEEDILEIDEEIQSNTFDSTDQPIKKRGHQPVSTLPLAPVNCYLALNLDQLVCDC